MPPQASKLFYKSLSILLKSKEFNLNVLRYEKESFMRRSNMESSARRIVNKKRKDSNNSNDVVLPTHKLEEQKVVLYEYVKFFDKLFMLISKKIGSEDHDKFDIELLSTLIFQLFDKSQTFTTMLINAIDERNKESIGLFNENPVSIYTDFESLYPEFWTNFALIEKDLDKVERLHKWVSLVKNSQLFTKLTSHNVYITNRFIQKIFDHYNENYVVKLKCRWECLYRYSVFVTFIYEQVRAKANMREIDEILMDAINAVLENNFYMNLFHSLLITKTNLNDFDQIDILLEFLANNLERMKVNKSRSLLNFEFSLIIKVVNHILSGDNFILIEKCLLFLYKYSKVIGERFITELWDKCLFSSKLLDLFLHWSSAVRKIFFYLIIFNYSENSYCKQKIEKIIVSIEYEKNLYDRNLKDKTLATRHKLLKIHKSKGLKKDDDKSVERIPAKHRIYVIGALKQYREVEWLYKEWLKDNADDMGKVKQDNKKDTSALPVIDIRILKDGLENNMIKKLTSIN